MANTDRVVFTKEMKKDYTILIPNMLHMHFKVMVPILNTGGYNCVLLENEDRSVIEAGKLRAAEGKKNFLSDETAMRKAEKVLYSEIALVMEIPLSDVVRFIENV